MSYVKVSKVNNYNYVYNNSELYIFNDFNNLVNQYLNTKPDSFFGKTENNNKIERQFKAIQKKQGVVGKCWDFIKNKLNMKNSSNSVNKTIEAYKKGLISEAEALNSVNKYIKGQTKALDFVADWGSTIVGAGVFALTMPLFASGVPAALGCAALAGGIFKMGAKFIDAKTSNRKYNTAPYDIITGGINGILSPLVNGIGNAVVKTTAKKLGLNVIGKGVQQTLSTKSLTNIIQYFSTYPKQVIQGSFINKIIPFLSGKLIRGLSKLSLAIILREMTFTYLEFTNKKRGITLSSIIANYAGTDNATGIINEFIDSPINIDFSNDVYGTIES